MKTLRESVLSARGVFFDLFHTLTCRESEWSPKPVREMLGLSREAWEKQLFETSRYRLAGEERDPFQIVARVARAINPELQDDVIQLATERRLERFASAITKIPAANLELLAALRRQGRKLALISNADAMEIHHWKSSPLCGCFDSTVFSCEVGWVKPEPEIFQHGLKELGLKASECVYVGDGGAKELKAARSLGFTTVMIAGIMRELWPEQIESRAKDADFVIEEPIEILPPEWVQSLTTVT